MKDEKVGKWSNLEKDEREGLSLRKNVQAQENVVFQTYKPGCFSLDSLDNYKTASQVIMFEFHSKSVALKVVINARIALNKLEYQKNIADPRSPYSLA